MADHFWAILACSFFVLALGFAGADDQRVSEAQDAQYCAQVERGAWPDYKQTYRELCAKRRSARQGADR